MKPNLFRNENVKHKIDLSFIDVKFDMDSYNEAKVSEVNNRTIKTHQLATQDSGRVHFLPIYGNTDNKLATYQLSAEINIRKVQWTDKIGIK